MKEISKVVLVSSGMVFTGISYGFFSAESLHPYLRWLGTICAIFFGNVISNNIVDKIERDQ